MNLFTEQGSQGAQVSYSVWNKGALFVLITVKKEHCLNLKKDKVQDVKMLQMLCVSLCMHILSFLSSGKIYLDLYLFIIIYFYFFSPRELCFLHLVYAEI